MNAQPLFALALPSWLSQEMILPAVVGVATGFLLVLGFHFLVRGRGDAGPPASNPDGEFDPFVQGSPTEQRSAHRRTGNPVELVIRNPALKGEPGRGWVMDRSMHGVCVAVEQQFAPGIILEVRPTNAPPITPWVEVEVLNIRQAEERWHLGCKFVRTPPWAMLLMFG